MTPSCTQKSTRGACARVRYGGLATTTSKAWFESIKVLFPQTTGFQQGESEVSKSDPATLVVNHPENDSTHAKHHDKGHMVSQPFNFEVNFEVSLRV